MNECVLLFCLQIHRFHGRHDQVPDGSQPDGKTVHQPGDRESGIHSTYGREQGLNGTWLQQKQTVQYDGQMK